MQTSPQTASLPLSAFANRTVPRRQTGDLAYQAMTVAAILMVLGSLWVF